MWLEVLMVIAIAPLATIAVCWCFWVVIVVGDWISAKTRSYMYHRRLDHLPSPSSMTELQLAERIWEIDWLRRHSNNHHRWDSESLLTRFQALCEQLELQQISREAHDLWQKEQEKNLISKYKNLF